MIRDGDGRACAIDTKEVAPWIAQKRAGRTWAFERRTRVYFARCATTGQIKIARGFSIHNEDPCLYAFRTDLVAIVHPVHARLRKAVRSLQQSPDYAALDHAELAALRRGGA